MTEPSAAPKDVDELFPPSAQSVDELFPPEVERERVRRNMGASPVQDLIFGNTDVSPVARVLDHFGQGFKHSWGDEPLGLSEENKKIVDGWVGKKEYEDGEKTLAKTFNQALMRPAAVGFKFAAEVGDLALRGSSGLFTGTQEAVKQGLMEGGASESLARDVAALPEAFMGTPHPMAMPKVELPKGASQLDPLLTLGKTLKVIGTDEKGWAGNIEARPTPEAARTPMPEAAAENPATASEVHTTARGIAPDLFSGYDQLPERRDIYTKQINELDAMRATSAEQAAQIAELKTQLQTKLAETQGQIHEMAPAVKEAYAEAAKILPDEQARPEPVAEDFTPPAPEAVDAKPAKPIEEQRAFITKDVEDKLVAAGRSRPEAQAAAAIDAAYWETRAARFEGKRGTPEEMYRREAPEILGPGMQSSIMVQRAKPTHERLSLTQFIAERGGIKDNDPLISDVLVSLGTKNKLVPGFGSLIRRDGKSLDNLREAAVEAGYLEDAGHNTSELATSNVSDLLSAIDQEMRGQKVYARNEEPPPTFDRDSHLRAIGSEIDHALREVEIDPASISEDVRHRAIEMMDKDGVRDPIEAYEKAEREQGFFQETAKTDTPEFQNWFGESKVTDSEGRPIVVYHGTARGGFDTFDTYGSNYGLMGQGSYFTENPAIASKYTNKGAKLIERTGADANSSVYPAYLSIKHPLDMEAKADVAAWEKAFPDRIDADQIPHNASNEKVFRELEEALGQEYISAYEGAEIVQDGFRQMGFDGITHIGGGRVDAAGVAHRVWIAFDPEQIKSAIGNRGTFDRNSPNILHQGDTIKRGKIRIARAPYQDVPNTITLLRDANAATFIHEKGHDYLSRIMRDADDPQAPAILKNDADAVFKWLGVKSAAEIKTSHHERFARGFENYMMEGRAPSHALARVFEQFRQWLLRIYTEAKRLKSPINDEIRGVFDRLLAVNPEKAVIAHGEAPSEAFATRHEAHLERPGTLKDDVVAGNVQAERGNLAAELPPGKQDARLAEIKAGLEERPAGSAQSDGHGDGSGTAAEGSRTGQEPGTVGEGGSKAAAETPSPRAGRPEQSKTVTPDSPHEAFAPDTVTDKAGNIRLDLLNTPDSIKDVIRQAAAENGDFQHVRGPVTDAQVADLADAMGIDAAYLSSRKLGEAWTAPEIVALRKALIQSATSVRDTMVKAAGTGAEADLLAYAEAKTRHRMIQERVSSVTAEAGRALRAFQKRFTAGLGEAQSIGDFLKSATGDTLFQLEREARLGASLETPSQVSKFIHDSQKATFPQMLQEFWINALLSGPITHAKNMIGNAAVAVLSLGETAATAGVGKIREALGNKAERVHIGETRANFFGLIQGAQDGLVAAKYAFKHEEQFTHNQTVEQYKYQAIPSKRIVLKTYDVGSPEYSARLESLAKARAHGENLTGEKLTARVAELVRKPEFDMIAEAKEKAVEIGGKQIRTPGRLLTAEDQIFKGIAYRQKLNELAYRQARNEGLVGDAFNNKVAKLTTDPSEPMMQEARKNADYQTFTNSLGRTGVALQMFANSHLLAKLIVPFIRTPLNLLKYANERSVTGVFSREVRANLSGVNGKIAQDTQIARMAIGTSIAAYTMYMVQQGTITGSGPSDQKERAVLMLSGWKPYSIKIGENYYSYDWLDPFSTIMGISADLGTFAHGVAADSEEMGSLAVNLLASVAKMVTSKSSLRGVSDVMQAVSNPDRYGGRYIQNLAGTVVPSAVAQYARTHDEYQREARTVVDVIKSRVPGKRQELFVRRDIWGEPLPMGDNLGPDAISPIAMSKITHDPATKALIDAGFFPAQVGRKIRGVDLTDQQYDDFARIGGKMAKTRVNGLVNNAGFSTLPTETRTEMLRNIIRSAREAARSVVMMQNPSIIKEAIADKMATMGR
jgi:hypothetical protein